MFLTSTRQGMRRGAIGVSLVIASLLAQSALAQPSVERTAKVGKGLYEIVFNPADQLVYVASTGSQDGIAPAIIGLDPHTLSVRRTIATGKTPPLGLALNTKTQKIYFTSAWTGSVGVYDVKTGKEIALVRGPSEKASLRQIAVDENTNTIFATVVGGFEGRDGKPGPKSELWVIDGKTNTIKQIISEPVKGATGLAIDSSARRLYVSDLSENKIGVFDLDTLKPLATFPSIAAKAPSTGAPDVEQKPASDTINVIVDPTTKRLYSVNQTSGTVTVLNAADGTILHTISTGKGALSARLNPKTGDLYVANRGDGTVSVVDTKTYFVTAHLPSGTYPQTIAIDPQTGTAFVTNKAKGKGWGGPKEAPEPFEPGGDTVTKILP